ncbi:glycosyltransferase family 2 protein [Porphyromonas sp.]|uniref:glycosyltransferase family 2 protein n=1 Tax=Porphyromonas sp. TaxID=1924944 RepID=UPI002A74B988|nr:glycosyltransferase family 2 protein [Porphyromonas sp.]MDY3066762.1 glycosyltransferase family 2 protein [Porphyromonas sp.]
MNLKISVVIPLYNKERTIVQTIESVINQTYSDFEIIVVNDGSQDKSADLIANINDPRIRLIHQKR